MFNRKFIRNTARGGLSGGLAWASLVIAFINMSEHEHTLWRLDKPLPWIVAVIFFIPAVYYFFADDEDKKESANATNKR